MVRQGESTSTQPNAPNSIALPPRLGLYFVYPPEFEGRVVELVPGLVLGRESNEDPGEELTSATGSAKRAFTTVAHGTVSRRHASIAHAFGVPILTDLGSSNGTRVNCAAVTAPTPLTPQSVVRFGDVLAIVDEYGGSSEAPASPLGRSPHMIQLQAELDRAAKERVPVLVLGETGTGKEWIAAEVHHRSGRTGRYVKLNSAELSPQIVESELFGHERGAFTGAVARHAGLFVEAGGGTLFLDEIGELPLELQAKLLRVLQEGEVRPVGSARTERVDVRVVAATNRDLATDVDESRFRRDLHARLSFFELRLPPLRGRRQDILWWLRKLSQRWCEQRGKPLVMDIQPAAAERLLLHAWPDNLRGLERLAHRLLLAEQTAIGVRALAEAMPEIAQEGPAPSPATATPPPEERSSTPARAVSERPTREEFLAVYEASGRNVRATSKHFGRDRRQVYRWLEAFGIER